MKNNTKIHTPFLQIMFFLLIGFFILTFQACSSGDDEEDDEKENVTQTLLPNGNYEINGHEAVDLGLSVKWATCNVGASTPESIGGYYAWGETFTKDSYTWDNYTWLDAINGKFIKYGEWYCVLKSSDDVATVKWGKGWRMPTKEEIDEFVTSCTKTAVHGKVYIDGKYRTRTIGYNIVGPSGKSIYLPCSGYYVDTELKSTTSGAYFWSSSGDSDDNARMYDSFWSNCAHTHFKNSGLPIRPVAD